MDICKRVTRKNSIFVHPNLVHKVCYFGRIFLILLFKRRWITCVVFFTITRPYNSSVSLVTRVSLDNRIIVLRFPLGARNCVQRVNGVHTASCTNYWKRRTMNKAAVLWSWPFTIVSAELKNTWRYNSNPSVSSWCVQRQFHVVCTVYFEKKNYSSNLTSVTYSDKSDSRTMLYIDS